MFLHNFLFHATAYFLTYAYEDSGLLKANSILLLNELSTAIAISSGSAPVYCNSTQWYRASPVTLPRIHPDRISSSDLFYGR